ISLCQKNHEPNKNHEHHIANTNMTTATTTQRRFAICRIADLQSAKPSINAKTMNTTLDHAAKPNTTTTTTTPASPNPTNDMLRLLLQQGEGLSALPKLQRQGAREESNAGSSVPSVSSCSNQFSNLQSEIRNPQLDATQAEFAADLIRELGGIDVTTIHRACLQLASLQIFKAIDEYGDDALREMLQTKTRADPITAGTPCVTRIQD